MSMSRVFITAEHAKRLSLWLGCHRYARRRQLQAARTLFHFYGGTAAWHPSATSSSDRSMLIQYIQRSRFSAPWIFPSSADHILSTNAYFCFCESHVELSALIAAGKPCMGGRVGLVHAGVVSRLHVGSSRPSSQSAAQAVASAGLRPKSEAQKSV